MNVNEDVVVVFNDAAEYEASVRRNRAFKDLPVDPYVIVCRDTYGTVEAENIAPDSIRRALITKNPEPYSTWLRVSDDWVRVLDDENSSIGLYDRVFQSEYFDRIDSLLLIFQALGIKKISIDATESESYKKTNGASVKGDAKVDIPVVRGDASAAYSSGGEDGFKRKLEKHICKEFARHNDFDREEVARLMDKYGFSGDKQLIALRDETRQGREVSKRTVYRFSGNFCGNVEAKVEAAVRIAAGVQLGKKKLGGGLGINFHTHSRETMEKIQSLNIVLEN